MTKIGDIVSNDMNNTTLTVISEDDSAMPDVHRRAGVARVEPKRHPNTTRKIKDWELEVSLDVEPVMEHLEEPVDVDGNNLTPPRLSNVAVELSNSILPLSLSQDSPRLDPLVDKQAAPMTKIGDIVSNDMNNTTLTVISEDDSAMPDVHRRAGVARVEPKRHPNTTRKIKDWELEVFKPVLIVGDSNLARIPPFQNEEIQVDSFPGATCYHICQILLKVPTDPDVKEVVLSVGLNNCLKCYQPSTTDKQLTHLITAAKRAFPNAIIRVPVINYSDKLDEAQQHLVEILNQTITRRYTFLNELPKLRFRTEPKDPVHWTAKTAKSMLEYWLDQLNL
ncbi:uncharacterized protein AB9X84_014314 [Acanthopagrus schlegelii]